MINSSTSRNDYQGTSTTATYSWTFLVNSTSELVLLETTGDTTVTKVLNSDYTAVQNSDISTGGVLTRTAGNLPTGTRLTVYRGADLTQPSEFNNQDEFLPSAYELALDNLEKQVQLLAGQLSVAIKAAPQEIPGAADLELPTITDRANTLLGFDSNGNIMPSGGTSSVAVSSYALPLVTAQTLTAFASQIAGKVLPVSGGAVTMAATENDFLPSDWDNSVQTMFCAANGLAGTELTGITAGFRGMRLWIYNISTQNLILKDSDTRSLANNRFSLSGGDITLSTGQSVLLTYYEIPAPGNPGHWIAL